MPELECGTSHESKCRFTNSAARRGQAEDVSFEIMGSGSLQRSACRIKRLVGRQYNLSGSNVMCLCCTPFKRCDARVDFARKVASSHSFWSYLPRRLFRCYRGFGGGESLVNMASWPSASR